MKLKIIEFITKLSDGGAENLVKEYAILIDKDQFDICIVTIRNVTNTAVYNTLKENNIRIIPVYPKWNIAIKIFNKVFGYSYIKWRLKSIFKKEGADVIHAHLYTLKYLYWLRKDLKNIPLFYTCHSLPKVYFSKAQYTYAKRLHDYNGLCIIALHNDMRKEINKLLNINDTVIIRNGINFERFKEAQGSRKRVRNKLNIPAGAFVVGHVGRFHPVKNHALLIKIFAELSRNKSDAFLLMVGDGEEREHVREELDKKGLQGKYLILSNRTDIPELMQAMDVFVFPSKYEGLGIALVEAQISGLRCIVSRTIPEAVLLTEQIVRIGLDESEKKWCEAILDKNIKETVHGHIEDYDMNREIIRLEQLYRRT